MKHFRTAVCLICSLVATAPILAQTGVPVPELQSIDATVEAFMTKWDMPGGSVALTYQGRLVYARGFGMADVDEQVPVLPSHVFRIASVSKSVTGAAISKLIEDGLLNASDKVFGAEGVLQGARYDTLADARMLDITVADLLHHVSGIGVLSTNQDPVFADLYVESQTGFGLPHSPADKIEYYLKTQTLARAPNTSYEYSNLGFLILGRIVEAVSGLSYEDYVKTTFFDPLGITTFRMGMSLEEQTFDDEVHYYDYPNAPLTTSVFGSGQAVPWPYGGMNVETFDSHGGWTASATDLVRFLVSIDGFDTKPDLLGPAAIQMMTTTTPNSSGYAFGWSVNGANNWWHLGSIPGGIAEWVRTGSGLTWALLFNRRPNNNQVHTDMDNLMWTALSGISSWPGHDLFAESTGLDGSGDELGSLLLTTYPNPIGSSGTIELQVNRSERVAVTIHDILGRNVSDVFDGTMPPGLREFRFDTSGFPSGTYLVRAQGEDQVITRVIAVSR